MKNAHTIVSADLAERFAADLTAKVANPLYVYTVSKRSRIFDKIVEGTIEANGKFRASQVHAFVERSSGFLIKPASYSAPQKNYDGTFATRFNLSIEAEYAKALKLSDTAGGYLYKR